MDLLAIGASQAFGENLRSRYADTYKLKWQDMRSSAKYVVHLDAVTASSLCPRWWLNNALEGKEGGGGVAVTEFVLSFI